MWIQFIDITLPSPAENLALDEALLEQCEEHPDRQVLRFWESPQPFVVLGRSRRLRLEVHLPECRRRGIPVLRRASGGGTILLGPGCLNYALILARDAHPGLRDVGETSGFILERHRKALEVFLRRPVEIQGTADLTLGDLKVSGNAQRRKRRAILFHGTFLHRLDLDLVESCLVVPPEQPAYRRNRSHREFLTDVDASPGAIKEVLRRAWNASEALGEIPAERTAALVTCRYGRAEWVSSF